MKKFRFYMDIEASSKKAALKQLDEDSESMQITDLFCEELKE